METKAPSLQYRKRRYIHRTYS